MILDTVVLTLQLASVTTLILLVISPPLAWWLSRKNTWPRSFIEAIVALPLVLPPTVLGFYLLIFFCTAIDCRGLVGSSFWRAFGL